jgi:hypothetical protein
MVRLRVLMVRPNIVFVSSGALSADNLLREMRGGDSPGSKDDHRRGLPVGPRMVHEKC